MTDSIEAIRLDLVAAGRSAAAVQWSDSVGVELLDGVLLCRREGSEVVVELLSRNELVSPERFPSEEAAAVALRRRLFSPPSGAKKTPEELAAIRERMLERIARERSARKALLDE